MSFKSLVRHINDCLRINFRVHLMIHRNVFKVRKEYRFHIDTVPKIKNLISRSHTVCLIKHTCYYESYIINTYLRKTTQDCYHSN